MGRKIKGYMVVYATGIYDDSYHTHEVAVFEDRKEAEACCKEIDRQHNPVSMFDTDEESPRTWWNIMYEAEDIMHDDPKYINEIELDYNNFNNRKDWEKREGEIQIEEHKLYVELVKKHYPDWDDEKIENAMKLEKEISMIESWEYGDCRIQEIEINLKDN